MCSVRLYLKKETGLWLPARILYNVPEIKWRALQLGLDGQDCM